MSMRYLDMKQLSFYCKGKAYTNSGIDYNLAPNIMSSGIIYLQTEMNGSRLR